MQETIENNAGGGPAVAVTSNPEASPVFQILSHEQIPLTKTRAFLLCLAAGGAFQLAYSFERLSFLIAVYLWCLIELTRLPSARQASYFGLLAGLLAFAPQLGFFWKLFGAAAIALWLISAFWIRMFLAAGRSCVARFGPVSAALLIPFFWLGFEFFRSELYYLRFSWLNAGYVFSNRLDWLPMKWLGNYGFGFVLVAAICLIRLLKPLPRRLAAGTGVALLAVLVNLPRVESPAVTSVTGLRAAGVQMEFPDDLEITNNLSALVREHPDAQLLVLSEYSVTGPVPEKVRQWCRQNRRYVVIGAEDLTTNSNYYDTAFVVGPDGATVFQQGKCVPVQFMKDGLPAREQKLWDSPWGRLGFCICYDLSYTKVTDALIRMGAQAIIVPTMDVEEWGRHEHELHARVAQVRAAEYGVPIFRVASSGISQCVDAAGHNVATAPMPGDAAMLAGTLVLPEGGHLPADRLLGPVAVCVTAGYVLWVCMILLSEMLKRRASPASPARGQIS